MDINAVPSRYVEYTPRNPISGGDGARLYKVLIDGSTHLSHLAAAGRVCELASLLAQDSPEIIARNALIEDKSKHEHDGVDIAHTSLDEARAAYKARQ